MSIKRIANRISIVEKVNSGILKRHTLRFHKVSNIDGSGKCDIYETESSEDIVQGVIFDITEADKLVLDEIEGLGKGYEIKEVTIELNDGSVTQAFTYYATKIDASLKPLCWYKEHVLIGARENNLPEDYIRKIEAVEYIEETNPDKRKEELSIYL